MSAAARIVKPGGLIILACECRDGVPQGSPYEALLRSGSSSEAILQGLLQAPHPVAEQWQAQIQTLIQRQATVKVFSTLPDDTVRACHLEPCGDIRQEVHAWLGRAGPQARVAVLPEGPLTIPYLAK